MACMKILVLPFIMYKMNDVDKYLRKGITCRFLIQTRFRIVSVITVRIHHEYFTRITDFSRKDVVVPFPGYGEYYILRLT